MEAISNGHVMLLEIFCDVCSAGKRPLILANAVVHHARYQIGVVKET